MFERVRDRRRLATGYLVFLNTGCSGRQTIPRLANPAPGAALAAARWTPARPGTASAVTESAGLRDASAASGAARPRVWRSPESDYRLLSSRGRSLTGNLGGPAARGAQVLTSSRSPSAGAGHADERCLPRARPGTEDRWQNEAGPERCGCGDHVLTPSPDGVGGDRMKIVRRAQLAETRRDWLALS